MNETILEARAINKFFNDPVKVQVLSDIHLNITKGEFISIIGKSGSGKSTLLYILSTMDTRYEGELLLDGESMTNKTDAQLSRIRNEKIGFVFQFHYLLNEFSVLKNVMLPGLKLGKYTDEELENRAMEKLKVFGMERHALKKAGQLSGGEKQRVAIARALINDPLIIMGDEPSGNLDTVNSEIVLDIFQRLVQEFKQTLLIVTHDPMFSKRTNRVLELEDGRVISS
jgi:lipoprotein-releasing system ATP-binding protein